MIIGIMNGYYRSGTTFLWKCIKQLVPDIIFLYEPHSSSVYSLLKNGKGKDYIDPLHKLPILKDFFELDKKTLEKYFETAKPRMIYDKSNYKEAYEILDIFAEIKRPVWIKSNQLHLLIDKGLGAIYNCEVVGIIRDEANIILSHCGIEEDKNEVEKAFLNDDYSIIQKWIDSNRFGIKDVITTLTNNGYIKRSNNLLELMHNAISYCNYCNYKFTDNCIDFNRFCFNSFNEMRHLLFSLNISLDFNIDIARAFFASNEFMIKCEKLKWK